MPLEISQTVRSRLNPHVLRAAGLLAALLFASFAMTRVSTGSRVLAHYGVEGSSFSPLRGAGPALTPHGTAAVIPDAPAGRNGGSLRFDGENDWFGCSAALGSASGNFCLEAWVRAADSDQPGLHGVVANGNGAEGYTLAQQGNQWVAFVGGVGAFPIAPVEAGSWTHLAMVADGPDCRLFIDRRETGSFRRSPPLAANFSIGDMGGGRECFHGDIHQVRLTIFPHGSFSPPRDLLGNP